jgi:hypothetical protein
VKISRWLLALVVLGLGSSAALADGIDPGIKLQGGAGSTGIFSPNDQNFSFTAFGDTFAIGGSEQFDFINFTNQLATGVNIVATLLPDTPALTFTCDGASEYFTQCSVTNLGGGQTLISFFDPNTGQGGFGGLPPATDFGEGSCDGAQSCETDTPGADFGVVVTDINGDLHNLAPGEGFQAQGTLVEAPEPPTVLFFVAGGLVLFLLKRYRKIPALRFSR